MPYAISSNDSCSGFVHTIREYNASLTICEQGNEKVSLPFHDHKLPVLLSLIPSNDPFHFLQTKAVLEHLALRYTLKTILPFEQRRTLCDANRPSALVCIQLRVFLEFNSLSKKTKTSAGTLHWDKVVIAHLDKLLSPQEAWWLDIRSTTTFRISLSNQNWGWGRGIHRFQFADKSIWTARRNLEAWDWKAHVELES